MNKNDYDWMHRDTIEHPQFEEEFEKEYKQIKDQAACERYERAYKIELAKHHDPVIAEQEAKRNLESDSGFYDNLEV